MKALTNTNKKIGKESVKVLEVVHTSSLSRRTTSFRGKPKQVEPVGQTQQQSGLPGVNKNARVSNDEFAGMAVVDGRGR